MSAPRWRAAVCAALLWPLWPAAQTLLHFSADERARIASHGPWPEALPRDASNRLQTRPAVVAWGRELFFDKALSESGRVACASCHVPAQAFQDGQPVPPATRYSVAGRRNTPSLLDVAGQRWFGWDGAHDSLWAASRAPLLKADEMGWTVAELAAHVRADAGLAAGYRRAMGAAPPADDDALVVHLGKALAAYQATLRSPRTPFDEFRSALLRGDTRRAAQFPLAAQRGLKLFIGRARCGVCHAGPRFSNGEFADIGVPFFVEGGVDPGRHGGLQQLLASPVNRLGRFNDARQGDARRVLTSHLVTEPRHFGEFRVPGLRQLTRSAPYMHNGSLTTLEDVVRRYSELDEERLHADGQRILRRLDLSAQESADLVAFLRSLSADRP